MKQENDEDTFFKEGILVAIKDLHLSTQKYQRSNSNGLNDFSKWMWNKLIKMQ